MNKYILLLFLSASLGLGDVSGENRLAGLLGAITKAYESLGEGSRIVSVEELQVNGIRFGYYFRYTIEGKLETTGIAVGEDLSVVSGLSLREIEAFRFQPPRISKIEKKQPRFYFSTPVIDSKTYLNQNGDIQSR